ncbi:hypothetical protein CONLIGDRAFT_667571 [Coniochaeta ligniaria NRRL 30616]|uniref:TPR-like protein n=1 Tax=Coniochaeta ligniaria NRRL 30616 TaxID=1408157 RepID=A0A1J7JVF0_9PEZI|nr:hypothetical protein CONLIGDRAFT_667571 [Coniochaeta ligniaria NRRL 30616]
MDNPQGHSRTRSGVRATRPRSSTKGPLDADDAPPLLSPATPSRLTHPHPPASPLIRSAASSPFPPRSLAQPRRQQQQLADLTHLLRLEIYHPLPTTSIPPPFRNSPKQPGPEVPIPALLAKGHYRAAAAAAAQALILSSSSVSPPDPAQIFSLLHVRLACLTLTDNTALAAQEVRSLPPDLLDDSDATALPWPLRVLVVRLRALGYGDQRRAVMSYYDLAREARAALASAGEKGDHSGTELWRERLDELGVRVAGALVEMDDLRGAAQLLGGLKDRGDGRLGVAKALLWLQLGDADAARVCAEGLPGKKGGLVVEALCAMADGEYAGALEMWRGLREEGMEDEMVGVNMAVCLLYVGRMKEGRALLESLVDAGCASHTLLVNLSMMYELCTERSRTWKMQLAERVAAMEETPSGWEKTNADFKL